MNKSAIISDCGKYRYSLGRQWDMGKPHCLFIMVNPSTADADNDDPTITRCIDFAKRWGYGGLLVVNLFAFRSRSKGKMYKHHKGIGPHNNYYIEMLAGASSKIICAWGNHDNPKGKERAVEVLKMLKGYNLYCIKINKATGEPSHPLYLKKNLIPVPYWKLV